MIKICCILDLAMSKRENNNAKVHNSKPKKSKFNTNFEPGQKYLMPGHLGWLVSHDRGKERTALLNTFHILNKFNPKPIKNENSENNSDNPDSDGDDISKSLADEIAALKGDNKKKIPKQFNKVDSGAKSMFFVKCEHLTPDEILKISDDMFEINEEFNVKGINRVIPVVASCKQADSIDSDLIFDTIKDLLKSLIGKNVIPNECIRKEIGGDYDPEKPSSNNFKLCLEVKVRNNSKIARRDLLKSVLAALQSLAPGIDFDYNDKTNMFHVDLMKVVCCFSIMKNYETFKKYNVMEHKIAVKKLNETKESD